MTRTSHEVSFFGFRDDGLRTGFQAALQRADGTPRPAVAAVRAAIAETASGCSGAPSVWSPAEDVLGADAELSVSTIAGGSTAVLSAGEEARAKACVTAVAVRDFGGAASRSLPGSALLEGFVGPGSIALELSLPAGGDVRAQVTIEFAAVSNPRRTTTVEHESCQPRADALDIEHVFA